MYPPRKSTDCVYECEYCQKRGMGWQGIDGTIGGFFAPRGWTSICDQREPGAPERIYCSDRCLEMVHNRRGFAMRGTRRLRYGL